MTRVEIGEAIEAEYGFCDVWWKGIATYDLVQAVADLRKRGMLAERRREIPADMLAQLGRKPDEFRLQVLDLDPSVSDGALLEHLKERARDEPSYYGALVELFKNARRQGRNARFIPVDIPSYPAFDAYVWKNGKDYHYAVGRHIQRVLTACDIPYTGARIVCDKDRAGIELSHVIAVKIEIGKISL